MDSKKIFDIVNQHTPTILGSQQFSKYAVLIPLVAKEDGVHLLFEVRSKTLRRQPGEICFPGGKIDKQDDTPQVAAIRETTEELGLNTEDINDVSALDYMVSPHGMIVYSYVGFITDLKKITPNIAEVGEIFTVPLSFFLESTPQIHHIHLEVKPDQDFPFNLIAGGENYNWRKQTIDEYFYSYEGKVIWGLTARITSHFVEIIRDAKSL